MSEQPKVTSKRQVIVASLIALLTGALAATTLAPVGGTAEDFSGNPIGTTTIECTTRVVTDTITGGFWRGKTVCNAGEVAISAGGYCNTAGNMVGASTTSGTTGRAAWLWCTGNGTANWYAVCCEE